MSSGAPQTPFRDLAFPYSARRWQDASVAKTSASFWRWFGIRLLWLLAAGACARLALYYSSSQSHFSGLSTAEILRALIAGLRFDASIVATFLGPAILALATIRTRWCQAIARTWVGAGTFMLAALTLADLSYFPHSGRHLGDDLLRVRGEGDFLAQTILADHAWQFVGGLTLALVMGIVAAQLARGAFGEKKHHHPATDPMVPRIARGLAVLAFLFIAIRGKVGERPLYITDAYALTTDPAEAQLALNGPFTFWHSVRERRSLQAPEIPRVERETLAATLGIDLKLSDPFQVPAPLGHEPSHSLKPMYVFVIIVESLAARYIDGYLGTHYGRVTPFLQSLLRESVVFENFYANGLRSAEGIQAILTGIPPLSVLPLVGYGLELFRVGNLGHVLQQEGIESFFVQSSARNSFRLDLAAAAVGIPKQFGREDVPLLLGYGGQGTPVWGWDYETLQFALAQVSDLTPTLGIIFTGTTHTPFPRIPFLAPTLRPPLALNSGAKAFAEGEEGFLHTLRYLDWSIEMFWAELKRRGILENSLIAITADHTYPAFQNFSGTELYRIPLILWGPSFVTPGRNSTLGSQIDLMPTVLSVAGWGTSANPRLVSFGQSLVHPSRSPFVPFHSRDLPWISAGGTIDRRTSQALSEALHEVVTSNRWGSSL